MFKVLLIFFCAIILNLIKVSKLHAAITSDQSMPKYMPHLLNEIIKRCQNMILNHKIPVVVFDLDSTLFNNSPRNRKIIEEFADNNKDKYPDFYNAVVQMKDEQIAYALEDTLKNIGINDKEILTLLKKEWYEKFFTDEYVLLDVPYDGAANYVNKLYEIGTKIVYLTGRDTPDMEKGTILSLKRYNFPIDVENVVLLTKPEKKIKDDIFKKEASEQIKKMGEVIAIFDNEPKIVNLYKQIFNDSIIIFIDTNHSPKAVPVDASIPWIKSWNF